MRARLVPIIAVLYSKGRLAPSLAADVILEQQLLVVIPDYVARCQCGSKICYATFIFVKSHKIANKLATTEVRKKINRGLESLEF